MSLLSRRQMKAVVFHSLVLVQGERVLRALAARASATILNFHRISSKHNPAYPPLDPNTFSDLLDYLKRDFAIVTLEELRQAPPKRPAIVLSFDDGYLDFIEYAVPTLKRHGLRANQNLIASCVETGVPPWNIRMYDFLASAPLSLLKELDIPGFLPRLQSDSDDARGRYALALSRHLKFRPAQERRLFLEFLEPFYARYSPPETTRMMSADDARSISDTHEIGCHSWSHESMGLEDDAFFRTDLARAQEMFSRHALPWGIYAFPNGSYRASHLPILAASGVHTTLLVDEKRAKARSGVLPRLTMSGGSLQETRFQALGYHARGVA